MKINNASSLMQSLGAQNYDAALVRLFSDKFRTLGLVILSSGFCFSFFEKGKRDEWVPGISRVLLDHSESIIIRPTTNFILRHPELKNKLNRGIAAFERLPAILFHPGSKLLDTRGCIIMAGDDLTIQQYKVLTSYQESVENFILYSNTVAMNYLSHPVLEFKICELDESLDWPSVHSTKSLLDVLSKRFSKE